MDLPFLSQLTLNSVIGALLLPAFHWIRRKWRRRKLGAFIESRPVVKFEEKRKKPSGKWAFLPYLLLPSLAVYMFWDKGPWGLLPLGIFALETALAPFLFPPDKEARIYSGGIEVNGRMCLFEDCNTVRTEDGILRVADKNVTVEIERGNQELG